MSKVGSWSTTPGSNNSSPPNGWPEGQAPSTVNDCAREMMAAVRTAFNDLQYFDPDFTPTYISATTFSVTGNQTSAIHAGRRLKIYDATAGVATTIYATVVTASFTALTTIQVSADAGQLTSSLSSFAIAILSNTNNSLPRNTSADIAFGNVDVRGGLSISGQTTMQGQLSVGGAVNFGTTLSVSGAAAFLGAVNIPNNALSVSAISAPTNLLFNTSGVERVRITDNGEMLIGATTSTAVGIKFLSDAQGHYQQSHRSGSATTAHVEFRNANGIVGTITTSAGSTNYNTSSDWRLKEDVRDAPEVGTAIDAIRVVSFRWREGGAQVEYGVIAQELAKQLPQAVTMGDNETYIRKPWAIDYSKIVPVLLKEIQSLRKRVSLLENSIPNESTQK